MPVDAAPAPSVRMGRAGAVAVVSSLALVAALLVWSVLTQISGAVVAQGTIAVMGKPKAVQHLDGGIVQDILVADGDLVQKGQVLIRLDPSLLEANLEIYRNRLAEASARLARLQAEQAGASDVVFAETPPLLSGRDLQPVQTMEGEIFAARAEIQAGRKSQLEERIRQFNNQIAGVEALIAAKREQVGFIEQELTRQEELRDKGLARDADVLTLQGNRADLLGQIAEHLTEAARIENSVHDTELEILQADRQFREEAVTALQQTRQQIEELVQQIVSTEKQLERIEIVAPVTGNVHELQIVTEGGIVPPGALIAQIIAVDEARAFEFRVAPVSVDNIQPRQQVRLRFAAFNTRTTPEIFGEVAGISPTTVMDETTGAAYYRVFVEVAPAELARLGGLELVPGMPIEGYIGTGSRSVADYLTRPIVDSLGKAFREE
ncbi:MAG: HlyD family type I secretion periplasmic adaptor subunit [Paracoccaceae bacterium]|uniref:HlyD family type I secretion periplasmic adaptor subunit n=1 Tax=Tabrizicola sp. TaxID=2005166 RepID=UPI003F29FBAE